MPTPEDPRPGWRALGQPDEFSPLGAESATAPAGWAGTAMHSLSCRTS
jgi:hypothetical protein